MWYFFGCSLPYYSIYPDTYIDFDVIDNKKNCVDQIFVEESMIFSLFVFYSYYFSIYRFLVDPTLELSYGMDILGVLRNFWS